MANIEKQVQNRKNTGKQFHIRVIRSSKEDKRVNQSERKFEKIMAENIPKLKKDNQATETRSLTEPKQKK